MNKVKRAKRAKHKKHINSLIRGHYLSGTDTADEKYKRLDGINKKMARLSMLAKARKLIKDK